MNDFLYFIKKYKVYFTYAGLVVISLLLINMNFNNQLGGFRSFVIVTVSKIQTHLPVTLNPTESKTINQELRQLNLELYSDVVKMKSAVKEYNKLKKVIEYKEEAAEETIVGKVIGASTVETRSYITIDQGKQAGVARGMAIRTDAGLVGSVVGVTENYAICEILLNQHVKVSVETQRTNCHGILEWQGGEELLVKNISAMFDVQTGDVVLTSNMSNKYPVDIPVGQITKVEEDPSSFSYKLTLQPFVDFDKLEYVFVIAQLPNPERIRLIENIERNLKNTR